MLLTALCFCVKCEKREEQQCIVSWKNARQYDMGPKIKRKQAYFHDESTFFKAFQLKLEDNLFFS